MNIFKNNKSKITIMSKSDLIPAINTPIHVIEESTLSNKVQVAGEFGFLAPLTYFAVNSVMVRKIGYDPSDPTNLDKMIFNEGMKDPEDPTRSLEFRLDLSKPRKDQPGISFFTSEPEAQLLAAKMNKNQKESTKKILDAVAMAYNAYDPIIDACISAAKGK
jgi:hypothetical protein